MLTRHRLSNRSSLVLCVIAWVVLKPGYIDNADDEAHSLAYGFAPCDMVFSRRKGWNQGGLNEEAYR